MDLNKMTQAEWLKYERMRKKAKIYINDYYFIILINILAIIFFIALVYVGATQITNSIHYLNASIYANNQTNTSQHMFLLQNLVKATNIGFAQVPIVSNSSVSNMISTLATNPKALASLTVSNRFLELWFILFTLAIALILVGFVIYLFFGTISNMGEDAIVPRSYSRLKRHLNKAKLIDDKLRANGFTEQEIKWYHEVRLALSELIWNLKDI